jgi:hypothetical protein
VELSEYRAFSGVRFATVLATSIDGKLFEEERIVELAVNPPNPSQYFPTGQ